MRVFVLVALAAALSGCAGPSNRSAVLGELNPAPMSPGAWARVAGTYTGPIRARALHYGFEDMSVMETRIDLSGPADNPAVVYRMDKGYSTAWTLYGEWKGTFTNLPAQRYGTQGDVSASTHAPNQMLLVLRRNGASIKEGNWVILTFLDGGKVNADWIGRAGWRGSGELWRIPAQQ